MNLFRRIISIFSIAVLVVAITYGLLWFRSQSNRSMNPESAIPPMFSVCVKINDFAVFERALRENSSGWSEILESGLFSRSDSFQNLIVELDSIRKGNSIISELFTGRVFFSMYEFEGNSEILISKSFSDLNVTEEWLKLLGNGNNINKKKYENTTFYLIDFDEGSYPEDLCFYESSGLLVISSSEELLKSSIRNLNSGTDVFSSSLFKRLSSTAGNDVSANIYLNYAEFTKLVQKFFKAGSIPDLSKLFSASVLDLEINTGHFILNGFTNFEGLDNPEYLNFGEAKRGFDLISYLPFDPVLFDIKKGGPILSWKKNDLSAVQNDFLLKFSEQCSDEGAYLLTKNNNNFDSYLILKLVSGTATEELIRTKLRILENNEQALNPVNVSIDNRKFVVYGCQGSPIASFLTINSPFKDQFSSLTIYENLLIFGQGKESLSEFIHSNQLGTTLNNNKDFEALSGNFSSASNRFIFINTPLFIKKLGSLLSIEMAENLENAEKKLKKFDAISFQGTQSEDLHYFRIFVNHTGEIRESYSTVWRRKLDTLSQFKPVIVKNHMTGDKEIFIQDENHSIYLISNKGNVIWKQKIDGPILGDVIQVDYYRNGKLQYLFNTSGKLYLTDRNGNMVEKFPVNFRSEATAGISLFDYDNSGEWRISVPTKDKNIYMYDKNGRVISGWNFREGDYPVNQPLQHFKVSDKDYIIAVEDYQIHFLDRKGKRRFKPQEQLNFSNNQVYFERGTKASMIASDKNGAVYRFFFDGKVENIFENNLSDNHYFLAEDVTGDNTKEFIFIDGDFIIVYNKDKKILFRKSFTEKITSPPVVYSFTAKDKKIGVVATKTGKIYLYNNDGSDYKGFPLPGSSMFSISAFPGLKDRFNLIVSNKDNFLYNYSVQ